MQTKIVNSYRLIKSDKWIQEHRHIAELILKRKLTNKEKIHHIDLNKLNNHPNNLALFESQEEHMKFHKQLTQFGLTNPLRRRINERRILNLK